MRSTDETEVNCFQSPSRQDNLSSAALPEKRRLDGIKFVSLGKFGGANQTSILPWPGLVALVRGTEAGSDGGDYTLRVAGVEHLTPRPDRSTSIHDRQD